MLGLGHDGDGVVGRQLGLSLAMRDCHQDEARGRASEDDPDETRTAPAVFLHE